VRTITQGYNIYKGSPFSRRDEGFTGSSIYSLDWTNIRRQGGSKRYPDDINVTQNFGCSSSLQTKTIKDTSDYQKEVSKEISTSLSGSYSGVGGAFTASSAFRDTQKLMKDNQRGMAVASAECNLFKISYSIPPCLSETLETSLGILPE